MTDDTKLHSTQHDVQKTLEKQVTYRTMERCRKKQLDYILVDRKRMYCSRDAEANDMIHMRSDHRSVMEKFVITALKKKVSQKTRIAKKKIKNSRSPKWQDDEETRSGEANKFEERYVELERKIKHEAETAAIAQKPKMTESLTMLEQAEGVVDAEVAAAYHWNEDTNAGAEVAKQSGRLVAEAEAAHHSNEDANAAAIEFEHADGVTCCGSRSSTPLE